MTQQMIQRTQVAVTAALMLALSAGAPADAKEGTDMAGHHKMEAHDMEMPMTTQRKAVMARMDSLDGVLTSKLQAVREAGSDRKKLQALEAVVVELIAQRRDMHQHMPQMMGKMMGHMMQHMGAGMMGDSGCMMTDCPMMQDGKHGDTGGMEGEAGADDHKAHH